jgi:hypothetical protein
MNAGGEAGLAAGLAEGTLPQGQRRPSGRFSSTPS